MRHSKTGIVYDARGFPIFDGKDIFNVTIKRSSIRAADLHKAEAARMLRESIKTNPSLALKFDVMQMEYIKRGTPQIPGYTWHHHQEIGKMQLIPRDIHLKTGHIGGMEVWFND